MGKSIYIKRKSTHAHVYTTVFLPISVNLREPCTRTRKTIVHRNAHFSLLPHSIRHSRTSVCTSFPSTARLLTPDTPCDPLDSLPPSLRRIHRINLTPHPACYCWTGDADIHPADHLPLSKKFRIRVRSGRSRGCLCGMPNVCLARYVHSRSPASACHPVPL